MYRETKTDMIDAAYEKAIDLDLFSALLSMAASTSEETDAVRQCRRIDDTLPWKNRRAGISNFFAPYDLRYVGEVLERFEEHFGPGIRNFRAVALAFAYASPYLSPNMFIGRQREDFLRKLEQEAGKDVYLQSARCLLANAKTRAALLEGLSKTSWAKTEEALFVLSLYEDRANGFAAMRPQMLRLWGPERSVSLFDNIRLLDWLISHYAEEIKNCRKKDNVLLRALLKLPCQFVRSETSVFQTLAQAGYSELEIRFANFWLALWGTSHDKMSADGIPGEKTAVAFCASLLNCVDDTPDDLFEYAAQLFQKYRSFDVKYEGNQGIWNAVQPLLHPGRPKTFLWMEKNIENDPPFPFDIFDADWDILAKELPSKRYTLLFTEQLTEQNDLSREDVLRWLDRYHTLTGLDYCAQFNQESYYTHKAFSFLVEKNVIDLWTFFSDHEENETELDHIASYALPVKSRQAFTFLQRLSEDHPVSQWRKIFGERWKFHDNFFIKRHDYGYMRSMKLCLQRDPLSDEELRTLYSWLDESVFSTEPENYYQHVACALDDSCVQRIFPKEDLAKVLKALEAAKGISAQTASPLKQIFFTPEELEEDQKVQAAAEEQAKAAYRQTELERKKAKLLEAYDGTLRSICNHIRYKMDSDAADNLNLSESILSETAACFSALEFPEQKAFIKLCKKSMALDALTQTEMSELLESALSEILSNTAWPLDAELTANFLVLCGEAVRHNTIPRNRIYSLIEKFTEEEKHNAANP